MGLQPVRGVVAGTGWVCRKGEIVNLRWREVEGDTLNLADSKTGPRKVFLNTSARAVIERQPRTDSPFVFPSPRDPERACSPNLPLWYSVRRQAGIEDVRLHDLRHSCASWLDILAAMNLLMHCNITSFFIFRESIQNGSLQPVIK